MVALLVTTVCDWCDGTGAYALSRGYVVWRGASRRRGSYVFKTHDDAARWRAGNRLEGYPIVEVLSETPFRWRGSGGALPDIVFADKLFDIYPDRHFPRGDNRAFLVHAPPELDEAG